MKISLVDMGKTKRRNVRESIISILSRNYPLSVKKIYNQVKKDYNLAVTYQAVFKLVKEMMEDGIITKKDREYQLNIGWIKSLKDELDIIQKNYLGDLGSKESNIKSRINSFVVRIAPKIKKYFGEDEACIVAVSGGGKLFGVGLWKYLLREGLKVEFTKLNWMDHPNEKGPWIDKKKIENRKILLVDSELYSGKTYEVAIEKINKLKKSLKIKGIKFVADKDLLGLSDL